MGIEIYPQFNKNQPVVPQNIGMTNGIPSLIDTNPDFFESEQGKKATNAGIILTVGMIAREALKKLSDGFFAKYFSRNQNIDEEEIKTIAKNMLESIFLEFIVMTPPKSI